MSYGTIPKSKQDTGNSSKRAVSSWVEWVVLKLFIDDRELVQVPDSCTFGRTEAIPAVSDATPPYRYVAEQGLPDDSAVTVI
jgi:hypothetical protein